ncbi:metallophosphoesterase [Olsenella profusa]|uniref:Metallophosphoesterase n=1 Tax=Olsenella profusa TaxID=138595 RepID=A0ABS2F0P0_9ACTN|nr:metallophosphoesterase [Olsenella profusa]MBM6774403.1 metallophosphoesterase [Olsenella profusa]
MKKSWKRWLGVLCAVLVVLSVAVVAPGWSAKAADEAPTSPVEVVAETGSGDASEPETTPTDPAEADGAGNQAEASEQGVADEQAAPAEEAVDADRTADAVTFERVSLEIGATESSRNFNWQANSDAAEQLQVVAMPAGWQKGAEFPAEGVTTVDAADPVTNEANADRAGWYTFRATADGLSANTTYLYRVGSEQGGWSDTYAFTTGDFGDGASFSFMFAGDPQIGASGNADSDTVGWTDTLNYMNAAFPGTDFLISAGDQINASDPSTVENEYEGYFAPDVLHSMTLATNVGNHETGAGNQHYSYNFNMPNESALGAVDSTGSMSGDYWFTYNGVLFMSLNSNDLSVSEHKAFMEDAIAQNPDANWKIVTFHHSVYSVANHTQDSDILQRRSDLPPVFSELGIDAVLMGHDHVYTRTYMMEGTTPVITDEVQGEVTDPAAGQVLYITANSASGSKYYEIQNLPQNTWAAKVDQSHRENMTRVEVSEDSLTFNTYYTDKATPELLDSFTIKRANPDAEPVEPANPEVERVSLEIGATESSRNFNWQGTTTRDSMVQVAAMPEGWREGSAFPADSAVTVTAEMGGTERAGWNSFKATVDGLAANTTYLYRVGNDGCWSDTYQFTTGDFGDGASFSFMFAGDPQIGASGDNASDTEGWINTLDTMNAAFPGTDFLISAGDQINSGDPSTVESEYEGYFAPEALHGMTLATNVGNHETYAGNQHYSYNFNMPNESELGKVDSTGDASGDYWFTYNGVLFMSLNSNNMSTSEHKAFMEDAIAKNPDANWKIVTFHHSVYSVADHTQDSDILQRRSELPVVFSDLGVDLVLMGHDHVYTRTYLMDGTTPEIPADGSVPSVLTNPQSNEVLYVTANSASGSKYYEIQNLAQNTFSAVQDQSHRENMTRVEVSDDALVVSTYYTDDDQVTSDDLLDTVTIRRTADGGQQAGQAGQAGQSTTKPAGTSTTSGSGLPTTGDSLAAPVTLALVAAAGVAVLVARAVVLKRRGC